MRPTMKRQNLPQGGNAGAPKGMFSYDLLFVSVRYVDPLPIA